MLSHDDPPGASTDPIAPATAGDAAPPSRPRLPVLRRWALRLVPLVLLCAAAVVLWREFHHISLAEVTQAMRAWGHDAILAALALSAVSFILMGVVEWLGLRWVGARLPWGPALAGSFLANAIAHSLGANLLVSGAVRARLYDRFGVSLKQVAATTLFHGFSFAVGISALGGAGLLFSAREKIAATSISVPVARVLGALLLAGALAYVLLCALRRSPLRALGRSLTLPSARVASAQLALGVVDNATAAAIIWILLPPEAVAYTTFVGAYAIACVVGLASSVPAGVGVFEGTMSTLLRGVPAASLAAAFLGYRLAYFLLPLIVACLALAGDTLRQGHRR